MRVAPEGHLKIARRFKRREDEELGRPASLRDA